MAEIMNKQHSILQILIAGPYRSGTNDDPALMEQNLRKLEDAALPIFRAGHLPVIGEWYALPLLKVAGSQYLGDPVYEEILYPVAARIIRRCDAILRLEGASKGADEDVRLAKEIGIPVYYRLEELLEQLAN